jgi:hypothetical protein
MEGWLRGSIDGETGAMPVALLCNRASRCTNLTLVLQDMFCKDRGKITLLLSARFRCLFIAIKWKRHSLHYTFNGNFIKLTYNNAYCNSNANGN